MPKPIEVAQLAVSIANVKLIREIGDELVASLEGIYDALAELSDQLEQVAGQIDGLQVSDITQEQLDDVATRIRDAAAKADALIEEEGEDATAETPAETPAEPERPVEGETPTA